MFIKISDYNKGIICLICKTDKTHIKIRKGKGSPVWYNYKDSKICQNCYNKLTKYPKTLNDKKSLYRLDYCGINLFLSFQLPKESCEICNITKKDRIIHRHHYFYCRIMP